MLRTRILTAVVLVAVVLTALFALPSRGWGVVSLLAVAVAATEWAHLAGFGKQMSLLFVGGTLLIGLDLLLAPYCSFDPQFGWPGPVVEYLCGAATLFWLIFVPPWLYFGWRSTSRPALLVTGWLLLLSTWVAVVQLQVRSPWLLLALMAIVWIADTAAYFSGRRFGKRKLAPAISPGKTWEGVYGALIAVALYALALLPFARDNGYGGTLSPAVALGWVAIVIVVAGLSIIGDLFESHLKRQRGVKDSGTVLPGHGGVLDRIDALLAAMPAAALVAQYLIR
jgi:phosphatidate cytidylyltransferase